MHLILEKDIENPVCAYARRQGWLVYKFTSPSRRSVPDRIFMGFGKVFFIEFKAPGKKPTEKQYLEMDKLLNKGLTVYIVDNVNKGKNLIDYETEHAQRTS